MADVYDLAVEGRHEFFVNGLLVHNCYEGVGRFFEARPFASRPAPPDPLSHLDALSRAHHTQREAPPKGAGGALGGLARR